MERLTAPTRRDLMKLGLASSMIAASLPTLQNNALAAGAGLISPISALAIQGTGPGSPSQQDGVSTSSRSGMRHRPSSTC
jgi:hypothetical protein